MARGPLDPLWWAEAIPYPYRRSAGRLLALAPGEAGDGVRSPSGEPSAWVLSLAPLYDERIRPLAHDMALELARLGRYEAAQWLAAGTLTMLPDDTPACLVASLGSRQRGQWDEARQTIETTLEAQPQGHVDPGLTLEYAHALEHTGDAESACLALESILADSTADTSVAARAREMMHRLQ